MLYSSSLEGQEYEREQSAQIMPPEAFVVCAPPPRLNAECANPHPLQLYSWGDDMHYRQDRHSVSSTAGSNPQMEPQVKHDDIISPLNVNENHGAWQFSNYGFSPNAPASPPQDVAVGYPYMRYPGGDNCTAEPNGALIHRYSSDQSGGVLTPPTATGSPFHDKEWNHFPPPDQEELHFHQSLPLPRQVRQGSPAMINRSDGVRKKNAKFDIPQERTIDNIDQMLKKTKDEEKRKELKMQKRLLKNREAALQSRQRKKQHTEHLEDEKRQLEVFLSKLQDENSQFKFESEEHAEDKMNWTQREADYKRRLEELRLEKESLENAHKNETAELHKKIHNLNVMLENNSTPVSTVPSSDGFDFASEMDNLAVGNPYWDPGEFFDDICIESDPTAPQRQSHSPFSVFKPAPTPNGPQDSCERLMVMLLLYGAYVASQSAVNPSFVRFNLPEDVQNASISVMDGALGLPTVELNTSWAAGRASQSSQTGRSHASGHCAMSNEFLHKFFGRGTSQSVVAEFKNLLEHCQP